MNKLFIVIFTLIVCQTLLAEIVPYGYNDEAGAYFDVGNNTKLYYEIYGEGDPILMLHGGVYGYIDEYSSLIEKLKDNYQVICLATRGHVKSDIGHEPFTFEQRANDAHKLILHLKLSKVTVIGFSDGGLAAYKLAALYPDDVEKMVVIGAGDTPKKEDEPTSSYTAEKLLKTNRAYFQKRLDNMPEPERWDECLQMLNDLYNNEFLSTETFEMIQCPVMVMTGDSDQFFNVESCLKAHRSINNSQLSVIPGCGHVIFFCNFPAVWESMKPFLGI